MPNLGVQSFYYTRTLAPRSVAIAQVSTPPTTPAQLTNIDNTPFAPGNLEIRKSLTLDSAPADFVAPDIMQSVMIHGATDYRINNQFFEITNILLDDGNPAYYVHVLPPGVDQDVVILNLASEQVDTSIHRVGNLLYHTQDGAPYRVRYIDGQGYLHTDLLLYTPALQLATFAPSSTTFTFSGRFLTLASTGNYWIRFTSTTGYLAVKPYNTQPNTPWYARIRFSLTPLAPEWAVQVFLPQRPYMLATWVPGVILDTNLIEFERKQMFFDSAHLPDILVYDKDLVIKYALDGGLPGSPPRRGTLFNWKRGLIVSVDAYKARIQLAVDLAPTDIVYGFYSYKEPDVIYRGLDLNPYTNPTIRDRVVEFYYKDNGADPFHFLYHQVVDTATGPIPGATNDPSPNTGTNHIFATLAVGAGISSKNFTIIDIRKRGGGLSTEWQDIPQAVNFWDLGFWDGRPLPIGGAMAVYIPSAILNIISKDDVEGKVRSALPMGVVPVIHYYDVDGTESV